MRHLAIRIGTAFIVLVLSLQAAETGLGVRTPQLGAVLDEQSKQLRVIEGVPGAANLGAGSAIGAVEQAWISPQSKRALVRLGGETPGLAIVDWQEQFRIFRSDALSGGADFAAISPSAKTFTRSIGGKIEAWQIGFGSLNLLWTADAPDGIAALAISDDGELVAVVAPGSVQVLQSAGRNSTVASMTAFGAMSFAHNSHAFLLGEETGGKALFFEDALGPAPSEILWEVASPESLIGISFSGDNRRIALALATETSGRVRLADILGQNMLVFDTESRPNGLFRAQGNAVFQLSSSSKGTIFLLDGDSPDPRLVTVPGLAEINSLEVINE